MSRFIDRDGHEKYFESIERDRELEIKRLCKNWIENLTKIMMRKKDGFMKTVAMY